MFNFATAVKIDVDFRLAKFESSEGVPDRQARLKPIGLCDW
jgi:hypothetical protein